MTFHLILEPSEIDCIGKALAMNHAEIAALLSKLQAQVNQQQKSAAHMAQAGPQEDPESANGLEGIQPPSPNGSIAPDAI